jgi:Putative quorum-sensing-regulated virulence factor
VRMPWGKHRGAELDDVPLSYLTWCLEECDLPAALSTAIRRTIADRLGLRPSAPPPPLRRRAPPAALDRQRLADALARWHRRQALAFHPDRGGDGRVMAAINNAHDELRELLAKV